ncbi:hypothetical protein CB0940_00368 [Cercospora beticola]|uniref:3'-5' exonuclease domain-containing protein n=1 Tax=Cercospora beticola TaxID=122368 RepID=A0A2G5I9L1_CERBT|nr:hypothetical protein CB0940_00368 [Cercospora beticola]PIB01485.1 hypothetical protein CB0940_00368 [Cercospora beticola]WPA95783.1 hypothetical protein RHO25_000386 [Cercospora beticola]CAK1355966.1 unnamed protein product [Cercospora beticola]
MSNVMNFLPLLDSSRDSETRTDAEIASKLTTEALREELARRQHHEVPFTWSEELVTPSGAWAFQTEASLSDTAVACASLAATGNRRIGLCAASIKGDSSEESEVQTLKNKVEGVITNLSKIIEAAYRVMRPTLYLDASFDALTEEFGALLTALKEQKRPVQEDVEVPKERPQESLPETEIVVVETEEGVAEMVDTITACLEGTAACEAKEPQLAVDLEGVSLGRDGDISIVQIFLAPKKVCFLVDVFTLGSVAFKTAGRVSRTTTIASLLEDPQVKKLLFDCRTDNEALAHLYGVHMRGVVDVQLMYSATRTETRQRTKLFALSLVATRCANISKDDEANFHSINNWGMAALVLGGKTTQCYMEEQRMNALVLNEEPDMKDAWEDFKVRVDCVKETEGYAMCNERPLSSLAQRYCAQDVALLGRIWRYCRDHEAWNQDWEERVSKETQSRLAMADLPTSTLSSMTRDDWTKAPEGWAEIEQVSRVTGKVIKKGKGKSKAKATKVDSGSW